MKNVLLCDDSGTVTGSIDRETAHKGKGMLHRAFSVFIFSPDYDKILIQRRSSEKTLFPMIWANTCCSHLREGEELRAAAQSRLQEEMGFICPLAEGRSFVYRAEDPGRGTEYEYDTILTGTWEGTPQPDPAEVAGWKWITRADLREEIKKNPTSFAPWFVIGLTVVIRTIAERNPNPHS